MFSCLFFAVFPKSPSSFSQKSSIIDFLHGCKYASVFVTVKDIPPFLPTTDQLLNTFAKVFRVSYFYKFSGKIVGLILPK